MTLLTTLVVAGWAPTVAAQGPRERSVAVPGATLGPSESLGVTFRVLEGATVVESPTLALAWTPGVDVDTSRSNVTVTLDGNPLTSWRLDENTTAEITLPSGLAPGFHTVDVHAALRPGTEDCRPRPGLVLEMPASALTWRERWHDDARVDEFPLRWTREGTPVTVVAPSGDTVLLAVLSADHLLRDWELETRHATDTDATPGPAIRLGITRDLELPPGVVSIIDTEAQTLTVRAHDEAGLLNALALLRSDRGRALCPVARCEVAAAAVFAVDDAAPARADSAVLTVAELGWANGWTARGRGKQRVRMIWNRPDHWTIRGWSEIRGALRFGPDVDAQRSRVEVSLNETPIASFPLAAFSDAEVLRARLPKRSRDLNAWVLDVEVEIVPRDPDECSAVDGERAWVTLDADTGLFVERDIEVRHGVRAFVEQLGAHKPALATDGATLDASRRAALATILHPLHRLAPDENWRRDDGCARECVRVMATPGPTELLSHEQGRWLPRVDGLQMPALRSTSSALIHVEGERAQRLVVWVPAAMKDPGTLDYRVLGEPLAFSLGDDGWQAAGRPGAVMTRARIRHEDAALQPAARSDQARLSALFDLAWLAISGLAVLLMGLGLRRARVRSGAPLSPTPPVR